MTAPVTAVITAFQRIDQTLTSLTAILACRPAPAEVIAHVDGGQQQCADAIAKAFPQVRVLVSATNVGPGGGRNRLVAASSHPLVASFDDDAYPLDQDYFLRLMEVSAAFPDASVIAPLVFLRGEQVRGRSDDVRWVADYCGAACVFRKDDFLAAGGYVPVPIAYGIEEADLALRLHAGGHRVLATSRLRAFHDTQLDHHHSPAVNAAFISNVALLAYLRYPAWLWISGAVQCLKAAGSLLRQNRLRGIWDGVTVLPDAIRRYREYRNPVDHRALFSYWRLRRHPRAAGRPVKP